MQENIFTPEQIQSLNELEMEVYTYVMSHKSTIPYMRIRELATEAHVSTSTVLRFCRKMNCDGYSEFKLRMKQWIGQQTVEKLPEDISEIRAFFDRVESQKFQQLLEEATSMIVRADYVIFIGIGNSGCISQYGARYFTNMGKFSLSVSDPFYPMSMNDIESSVIIVLSVSGETEQIVKIMNGIRKVKCNVISITNTEQCTVARMSDLCLSYYIGMHRGNGDVDYSSQIPAATLIEILGKRVQNRLLEDE